MVKPDTITLKDIFNFIWNYVPSFFKIESKIGFPLNFFYPISSKELEINRFLKNPEKYNSILKYSSDGFKKAYINDFFHSFQKIFKPGPNNTKAIKEEYKNWFFNIRLKILSGEDPFNTYSSIFSIKSKNKYSQHKKISKLYSQYFENILKSYNYRCANDSIFVHILKEKRNNQIFKDLLKKREEIKLSTINIMLQTPTIYDENRDKLFYKDLLNKLKLFFNDILTNLISKYKKEYDKNFIVNSHTHFYIAVIRDIQESLL